MMVRINTCYNQECTPDMFEREQDPILWPMHTKLLPLLSEFMDGDEMKSRTFPDEWSVEFYRTKGLLQSLGGTQ